MNTSKKPIRVVLAKPGLDGHDRGARVLALGLKDAGMEVIYLGIRTTPEMVARAAIDDDADVVALSCLSGAHDYHFSRVAEILAAAGKDDVLLLGGGVIPDDDIPKLQQVGFKAIFGPGAKIEEIVEFIHNNVSE